MKKITVLLPLFFVFHVHGQEKMMDYCGLVIFEASIPFFKEIKARNEKVICVSITESSEITCWMCM